MKTFENNSKIITGQGDDYASGCLLAYTYFKKCQKMIKNYFRKKQDLDVDPKAIKQIRFTRNLYQAGKSTIFF